MLNYFPQQGQVRWRQLGILICLLLLMHGFARYQVAASSGYLLSAVVTATLYVAINACVARFKPQWFSWFFYGTIGFIGAAQQFLRRRFYDGSQAFWIDLLLMFQWLSVGILTFVFLLLITLTIKNWRSRNFVVN